MRKTYIILKLLINITAFQDQHKNIINYRNSFGKTALHYFVVNTCVINQSNLEQLINLFIKCGADLDIEDQRFRTPIYCAIEGNCLSGKQKTVVKALVNANCDSLNLYQIKNLAFSENFTLKQICRTYLINKYSKLLYSDLSHFIPKELIFYLNRKLVNVENT